MLAPTESAEGVLACAHAGLRASSWSLESQAQIGAQAQGRVDSLAVADRVPVRVADVPPCPLRAPIVERRCTVDLQIDEAVQAVEDAEQDMLGLAVARGPDISVRTLVVVMPGSDQQHRHHLE